MQQHDMTPAIRREQLATLALNVTRQAMAGELQGLDALAVVSAIRAIRNAIPEAPAPETGEAFDAA